ncbi:MAG: hypothetical protein HYU29_01615 [Chloroflexi bacterium]|nr:hypothetical protein [Chloroflexota bacterium]
MSYDRPVEWQGDVQEVAFTLPGSGVVRGAGVLAAITMMVAASVLFISSFNTERSHQQWFAALITALLALFVLYGAMVGASRSRSLGLLAFGLAFLFVALFPLVRYAPLFFKYFYHQDVEGYFPPLWFFSASLPLLVVSIMELAMPARGASKGAGTSLVLAIAAAVLVLFFGGVFVSALAPNSRLLTFPDTIFLSLGGCVVISTAVVFVAMLPRKGYLNAGAALLVLFGMALELASIRFYGGTPRMILETDWYIYRQPFFPLVAILGGTIPGALCVVAGVLLWWNGWRGNAVDLA